MGLHTHNHNLHSRLWMLFGLILFSQSFLSWAWFFSSNNENSHSSPDLSHQDYGRLDETGFVAEFSMESVNNQKSIKLVENAKRMLASSNSCRQKAYQNLFASCSEILASEEQRSRLAWHLSDCFQKDSGRPPFPNCDVKFSMIKCLKNLDEDSRRIYLEFYLETNSICHHLQTDAFKRQTERLVNELKRSAQFADEKLENIQKQAQDVLENSNQIHDSLASIDVQTQKVAEMSKNVEDRVSIVLNHTEAVYEQSKGIADSQSRMLESQAQMKEKLEEGMVMIHDSHKSLGLEIDRLHSDTVKIEEEISRVGNKMSLKMSNIQSKADDIWNIAGVSLDKQKELLEVQASALDGIQLLTNFLSQALEESRGTLQQLTEFGQKQQEELLKRQADLQTAHDYLFDNSKAILEAQEAFETKQASMFTAIDKLFALHNAMLLESRLIKTFIVYSILIFVLYMFTSTKQTYTVRPRLYIGLCLAFLLEFVFLRYAMSNVEQQAWIVSLVRSFYVLLASIQLLYAIFTYRDYEVLNHQILLTIMEKVNGMQMNKELSWEIDSEVDWPSWIETELPHEVDECEDPNYIPLGEIGENSVVVNSMSRGYNLRNRRHRS